ncbi:MAG: adenylate kinase [Nitriliruptorales bacterium]
MRLVLLGPPGAGKGTQAARIAAAYGIPHISTGEILRANVREGTDLGKKAQEYMDAGELVPDEVVVGMVAERLEQDDARRGFVFDGFPRTVPQAQSLEEVLTATDQPLDVVLRFDIDEDEVLYRITGRRVCTQCGRSYHIEMDPPPADGRCAECGGAVIQREDDTEEVVRNRLDVHRRQTEPLEVFYRQRGLLRDVAAVGEIDEVTQRALDVLSEYARPENGTAA